ncbi:hypothetical protein tinsulaeT_13940 [Thalassotalea insulae]|uniref:Uncharacterized protein n=1 Tax=Thalassotalea insulae TaxID=2056778 RepID=A0ABQ6GSA0_9GAMM|nr:hypothetical protein [Thalassotalea insulae]GLX78054.1 hypothetical protein tinsulaeT_13940 [Thalassotalea insulae]
MNQDDFDHFNYLAEKVIHDKASQAEINEFHNLVQIWNTETKYNLFNSMERSEKLFING